MATCLDYAKIACGVYHQSTNQYYAEPPGHMIDNWEVQTWEDGTLFGDGFQGGIWQNDSDVVVGCCGTNPGQIGKFFSDISADIRIGVHILPNQCSSARDMVRHAKSIARGRKVSVTGHSLGGGLAQVVAVWEGVPFVSFNAPAMKLTLQAAQVNIFKPMMMIRTIKAKSASDSSGLNFRIDGDLVSCKVLGDHVGTIVTLGNPKALHKSSNHAGSNCWQAVMNTDWAFIDPFEAM